MPALIVSTIVAKLLDDHPIVRVKPWQVQHLARPPGDDLEAVEFLPIEGYQLPLLVGAAVRCKLLELGTVGRIWQIQRLTTGTGHDCEENTRMIEVIVNQRQDNRQMVIIMGNA